MNSGCPNVLFVFADQLGAVYTGCYGHQQVRTPNLDGLAGRSVMFRNAYTAAPLCTPFRGTLFTGRYPAQTGIFRNSMRLPPSETTLASLFNQAGYLTSYAGKWHLAGLPRKIWVPPCERGGFSDFVGWDCGHVWHIDQKYFDGDSPDILPMPGHETDVLTDLVISRLRRHAAADRPFCMFAAYQAPHPFCDPPDEYRAMYRGKPLAFRPTVDRRARFRGYGEEGASDIPVTEWTESYFGEITHLDAAVGRLLAEVDALGLANNTIVVFTSDHGDMGGSRGRFEKNLAYEESSRIPLMIRLPGKSIGRETEALFSSVDFMPTLLGLCGLPAAPTAEGVDYSALIRGNAGGARRENLFMQTEKWACVRTGDLKLTLTPDAAGPTELYRLSADPFEQRNIVAEPAERETVLRMQGLCRDWLRDIRERTGDVEEAARPSPGWSG